MPAKKIVHVILDNYAAHKHPKVRQWLHRHPRFTFQQRHRHQEFIRFLNVHRPMDLAFEDIESSEQRRCAMAFVVVGHRAGSAFLHRQAGLGAVERLDLRLFVDREDDGMGGRIDIKPDNIAQLVDELRVVGKLELVDPVRLETMRAPDALDGTR